MKSCLRFLIFLVVWFVAYYALFELSGAESPGVASGFCALMMTIATARWLAGWSTWKDLRRFGNMVGQLPFADGQRVALEGRIEPAEEGKVLKSPFTQTECVICRYGIFDPGLRPGSTISYQGRQTVSSRYEYKGYWMVPCNVVGECGRTALLSFPEMENFVNNPNSNQNLENATNFIRSVTFPPISSDIIPMPTLPALGSDVPVILQDFKSARGSEFLNGRVLEEECLKPADHVCVVGKWSQEKQGIVADGTTWPKVVRLNRMDYMSQLKGQRTSAFAWSIVLTVLTNVVVFMILYFIFWQ